MRILHFLETLAGGPASYLNELIPYQLKHYEHVAIYCPEDQQHYLAVSGAHIHTFSPTRRKPLGMMNLYRQWIAFSNANSFDVVHMHSSFAGLIGRLAPQKKRATSYIYCAHGWAHGTDAGPLKRRLYANVERLLAMRTSVIINIARSETVLARQAGIPEEKCVQVYNGIGDAAWQKPVTREGAKRLLFVGRYDRQKGVDVLLKAMEQLHPLGYELTMIGGAVVSKSAIGRPPNYVTDLGWQSPQQIRDAMADTDIVVMPSRWEGFGLVAVEAMRAGRPVAASRVGGLQEVVAEGQTGVLFEPESPQALVEAILSMSNTNISVLGEKSRERFEKKFTSSKMFSALDKVYKESYGGLL